MSSLILTMVALLLLSWGAIFFLWRNRRSILEGNREIREKLLSDLKKLDTINKMLRTNYKAVLNENLPDDADALSDLLNGRT